MNANQTSFQFLKIKKKEEKKKKQFFVELKIISLINEIILQQNILLKLNEM